MFLFNVKNSAKRGSRGFGQPLLLQVEVVHSARASGRILQGGALGRQDHEVQAATRAWNSEHPYFVLEFPHHNPPRTFSGEL
ncbi:hypothetical protein E2C01_039440 [Portunus trituberculatus]|uniref:Uncharacterized protein n=1 Tax=Portunus trituberculatus TaxID=210409 RepID=A0A5B7FN21_PORTR|nr:hypothetical protein [Portunus trituberculatus]